MQEKRREIKTSQRGFGTAAACKKRRIETQSDILATSCEKARDRKRVTLFATAEAALRVEHSRWLLRTTSRVRLFRYLHAIKSSWEQIHKGVRKAIELVHRFPLLVSR